MEQPEASRACKCGRCTLHGKQWMERMFVTIEEAQKYTQMRIDAPTGPIFEDKTPEELAKMVEDATIDTWKQTCYHKFCPDCGDELAKIEKG